MIYIMDSAACDSDIDWIQLAIFVRIYPFLRRLIIEVI